MEATTEVVGEVNAIFEEYKKAVEKYPRFHTPHEGWAVIKKELDELWKEVRTYPKENKEAMRKEAIQIGAMALRFLVDVCGLDK